MADDEQTEITEDEMTKSSPSTPVSTFPTEYDPNDFITDEYHDDDDDPTTPPGPITPVSAPPPSPPRLPRQRYQIMRGSNLSQVSPNDTTKKNFKRKREEIYRFLRQRTSNQSVKTRSGTPVSTPPTEYEDSPTTPLSPLLLPSTSNM